MTPLPTIDAAEGLRTRRWDAVVVGSGLPALAAAIRIGMAGQSVLVVEESASRSLYEGIREPFFLAGAEQGGPLDLFLRDINLALIDRRRLFADPIALQVVGPDLRLDVGVPALTTEELVAWNLASPERALSLVQALGEASQAELRAMLDTPLVRTGRRLNRPRAILQGSDVRGLPSEAAEAPAELGEVLRAQVQALSNLATATPSPEAQARLLGSPLAGGVSFSDGPPWLMGLLRQRVESVYGEFRSLPGRFKFVTASGHPGIALENSRDVLVGRALVVAVPGCAIEAMAAGEEIPKPFHSTGPCRRRIAVHFRAKRSALPEAMGSRVILLPPEGSRPKGDLVTLSVLPRREDPATVDLVARIVVDPADDLTAREDEVEMRLRWLLPFASGKDLVRRKIERPRWDDDGWLEDPPPNAGWPAELDVQISSRQRIYHVARSGVAALGFEGDLLAGWRAGDAIGADLQ